MMQSAAVGTGLRRVLSLADADAQSTKVQTSVATLSTAVCTTGGATRG